MCIRDSIEVSSARQVSHSGSNLQVASLRILRSRNSFLCAASAVGGAQAVAQELDPGRTLQQCWPQVRFWEVEFVGASRTVTTAINSKPVLKPCRERGLDCIAYTQNAYRERYLDTVNILGQVLRIYRIFTFFLFLPPANEGLLGSNRANNSMSRRRCQAGHDHMELKQQLGLLCFCGGSKRSFRCPHNEMGNSEQAP